MLCSRKSYRNLQQNCQAVVAAEKATALTSFQSKVGDILATTRLPFRLPTDALFPNLQKFLDQYEWAQERYSMYALQGPSQAAKTSFAKSLFRRPFLVTVQGQRSLDLRGFEYGSHDALILDNLNSFQIVLDQRAVLQANNDVHKLGESTTGIYSYSVYLWAVPILLTLDLDVAASKEMAESEWLRANILLDVLPEQATCYMQDVRRLVPMTEVPRFGLAQLTH